MMAGLKTVVVWWLVMGGCVAKLDVPELEELRSALVVTQLVLSEQAETLKHLVNSTLQAKTSCAPERCCPYPYKRVLDECFYLSSKQLAWSQARHYCQGMKGDLATPKHVFALVSFVLENGAWTGAVWIGATDQGREGVWQWVNGQPIAADQWTPGQPDNAGGAENCMDIRLAWHPSLNDFNCVISQRFVCQYNA
ncbi:perlucin [Procambarus clarkii]|uniref:perlucin n=1 Tax=Procambarus clarkii TaxID=6728 RepID=UPI0037449240